MALQKTIIFKGIPINAYIKVSDFSGSKDHFAYALSYHASADAPSFHQTVHEFGLDPDAVLTLCYANAKGLPEMAEAVDV